MKLSHLVSLSLILIFAVFFVGCTLWGLDNSYRYLPKKVASGVVEFDNHFYYIVKPEDFTNTPKVILPYYKGTVDNYHLFFVFIDFGSHGRITSFAINRDNCIVENERTPEGVEVIITQQSGKLVYHRRVLIEDGNFIVKKREVKLDSLISGS